MTSDPTTWLEVVRAFVQSYLPKLQSSAECLLPAGLAIALGLLLVFRSAGMARFIIATVGTGLGAWAGYSACGSMGVSMMVGAIVGGLILGAVAHRTWRLWFLLAVMGAAGVAGGVVQLDRKSLAEIVAPPDAVTAVKNSADAAVTLKDLEANWQARGNVLVSRARERCGQLGARGFIIPALAAVMALAAVWWATPVVAALLLGLVGAVMTVSSATMALGAEWADIREMVNSHPDWFAYAVVGLWGLGLLTQGKRAMKMRKTRAAADGAGG